MSFTDQLPVTPGSVSCESDKPAYDFLIAAHALSSCFKNCCLSMVQDLSASDRYGISTCSWRSEDYAEEKKQKSKKRIKPRNRKR